MNLIAIFLTGLFTGGLTCLAVQGGLLAATLAQKEEEKLREKSHTGTILPILSFLGAKLVAYTILGMLLGIFGSVFQISLTARMVLQVAVAIFMIGTALNLLQVHPIFRFFVIQPPRFLAHLVRNQSRSNSIFAPALLGAFTIFIPCGTTQAMMALAIASGNPLSGTLILFSFILGTTPVFFILGYLATRLGEATHQKFMKIAAVTIIILAVLNLNSALTLATGFSLTDVGKSIVCTISFCAASTSNKNSGPVTEVTINIDAAGYSPNVFTVKAGTVVNLKLTNIDGYSCIQAFTIPKLGIQRIVRPKTSDTITFTAPIEPGDVPFMCSMGMYRGVIKVI